MRNYRPDPLKASLTAEFGRIALWGVGALVVGGGVLGLWWHWRGAGQWILQAGLLWGFVCIQVGRRLQLNRPGPDSPLYETLGWGNRLTILRAWLIAAVGGFLFQPWPDGPVLAWVPGTLYFVASALDRIDGFVARRTGHRSLFGEELDMVSDALGMAVASLLAFGYGQVHMSYLLLGVAYYLFHGGLWWRERRGLPVYELPPGMYRRAWAGFQMGFLVAALWPLFSPAVTAVAGFAFMAPALVGFLVDWLIVSGRIERGGERVERFFRRLAWISHSAVQPGLRLAVAVLLAVALEPFGWLVLSGFPTDWENALGSSGVWLAVFLILLGISGRAACVLLVGLLGWHYSDASLRTVDVALLCGVVWLMLLGTGRFSLWREDEQWINRHDGA